MVAKLFSDVKKEYGFLDRHELEIARYFWIAAFKSIEGVQNQTNNSQMDAIAAARNYHNTHLIGATLEAAFMSGIDWQQQHH